MHYRTIFVSDVHLGSKDCKAAQLNNFLKMNSCDTLYLIGDIIDGWKIQQNSWRWSPAQTAVIRRILGFAKRGTAVIYVAGNHDEFMRPLMTFGMTFPNIELCNEREHYGKDGKKYLVVHGDLFDGISKLAPWLSILGDRAYGVLLSLNTKLNWVLHKLGWSYFSLSKFLKHSVKQAVDYMFQFEKALVAHAERKKCDGVICGHIHHAEIKEINGRVYMNDGDWVESCTALVEHENGKWEIVTWDKTK